MEDKFNSIKQFLGYCFVVLLGAIFAVVAWVGLTHLFGLVSASDTVISETKISNEYDISTGSVKPEFSQYLVKTDKIVENLASEVLSKRTFNSRTVKTSVSTYKTYVYAGMPFYKDLGTGLWYYTETKNEDILKNPISKLFNLALADSTSTFSGSGDGMLGGNDGVWANIVAWDEAEYVAGQTSDVADQWLRLRQVGGTYYIQNPFLPFYIGNLPEGWVADDVSLFLYGSTACTTYDEDGTDVVVVSGNPTDPTTLAVGDWDTRGTTAFAQKDLTDYIYDGWVETAFNSSGIASITENSWNTFVLRTALDLAETAPLYRNDICFYFSEAEGKEPYITIDYTIEQQEGDEDLPVTSGYGVLDEDFDTCTIDDTLYSCGWDLVPTYSWAYANDQNVRSVPNSAYNNWHSVRVQKEGDTQTQYVTQSFWIYSTATSSGNNVRFLVKPDDSYDEYWGIVLSGTGLSLNSDGQDNVTFTLIGDEAPYTGTIPDNLWVKFDLFGDLENYRVKARFTSSDVDFRSYWTEWQDISSSTASYIDLWWSESAYVQFFDDLTDDISDLYPVISPEYDFLAVLPQVNGVYFNSPTSTDISSRVTIRADVYLDEETSTFLDSVDLLYRYSDSTTSWQSYHVASTTMVVLFSGSGYVSFPISLEWDYFADNGYGQYQFQLQATYNDEVYGSPVYTLNYSASQSSFSFTDDEELSGPLDYALAYVNGLLEGFISNVAQRFPFSWIITLYNLVNDVQSTSPQYPSFILEVEAMGGEEINLFPMEDIFSNETYGHGLVVAFSTIRTIAAYATYAGFAYFIFRRAQSLLSMFSSGN